MIQSFRPAGLRSPVNGTARRPRTPQDRSYPLIRVVVVEEMGLLRTALCAALSSEEEIEVVAEVTGVAELPALVRRLRPDVVLVDLAPDAPHPVEVVAEITGAMPDTAVLAMGRRWSQRIVGDLLAAGVRGLVGKDASLEALVDAVRELAAGEGHRRRRRRDGAAPRVEPADAPGGGGAAGGAEGLPLKEIARRLYLAHGTVRNHLSAIMRKTGARNRMEAVWRARRDGWM